MTIARPSAGTVSLRRRLILIPAAVAMAASALALALLLHQARQRVMVERASATEIAEELVRKTLSATARGPADPVESLTRTLGALPTLRHVRLFVLPRQASALDLFRSPDRASGGAPGWFAALLRPAPWERWHELAAEGKIVGHAVIVADPDDEIAELWRELVLIAALLAALTVTFVGLVSWSVTRALRPLGLLSTGLDRLERGDFEASLPSLPTLELRDLGAKFNRLAETSAKVSHDNRLLIERLLSLQENERNLLAHELHDELGPCLFGIRAQAACIARSGRGRPEEAQARTILGLSDELQKLNRRILGRLRPMALEDMGLPAALAQLVEDWRGRHPAVDWQFICAAFERPPDEEVALTVYRVAQECLTNAARHSGATRVRLEIGNAPAAGLPAPAGDAGLVWLTVIDDGRGLAAGDPPGFGLLGIRHRVRSHGGILRINSGQPVGLAVEAALPLRQAKQGGSA